MKKIEKSVFEKEGTKVIPGESVEIVKDGKCEFILENKDGKIEIKSCKPEKEE